MATTWPLRFVTHLTRSTNGHNLALCVGKKLWHLRLSFDRLLDESVRRLLLLLLCGEQRLGASGHRCLCRYNTH